MKVQHVTRVGEQDVREDAKEVIFDEVKLEDFPKLMKTLKST